MTASLKSCMPALAGILGEKPSTLYERQRALVREGLLEASPGQGPGSGVRATPDTIAVLLISLLATVRLTDAGPAARQLAEAISKPKCALTGAKTFREALARILTDETLAKRVNEIKVQTNGGFAAVAFDGGHSREGLLGSNKVKITRQPKTVVFVGKVAKSAGVTIEVVINGTTIGQLTKGITGLLGEQS